MFTRLELQNFKNFRDAKLELGPFTLLVGTNASGKTNVRDALRFLHGVGRGYKLAEVLGQKWGDGGVLQWRGIRGGAREVAFHGESTFGVAVGTDHDDRAGGYGSEYAIGVAVDPASHAPRLASERLGFGGADVLYEQSADATVYRLGTRRGTDWTDLGVDPTEPILPQLDDLGVGTIGVRTTVYPIRSHLRGIRFLEPIPDLMREPSPPGIETLGDRGENLSSVLQTLCSDASQKEALLEWLRRLTPMDISDVTFPEDQRGWPLLELVEADGRRTSAYCASDGTLRFLALVVALLGGAGRQGGRACFFLEELDAGIHPTRLHLLLQLIEQQTSERRVQVIATTHSPQVLALLSETALESATLVYRVPGRPDGKVRRIVDLPEARRVLATQDLARLLASGWLEDVVEFTADDAGAGAPA